MTARFPAGKLPHNVLGRLLDRYASTSDPRLIVPPGIGEDATVIDFGDRCLVAKTDPITFATDEIGWYAVHVNANDIAAMGATPRFFLATVIVPEKLGNEDFFEKIFRQIHEACTSLGVTVAGGHSEVTFGIDRPLVVGQMLGECDRGRVVRSSGLQVGDAILLTKGLAIEATSIIAREKAGQLRSSGVSDEIIARSASYLTDPGISVVTDARVALASGDVHALHDPTEGGVATGLLEITQASGVGLEIYNDRLPISNDSANLCEAVGVDPLGVISSGALLIGCNAESVPDISNGLTEAGIAVAHIGDVRDLDFGVKLRRGNVVQNLPRFAVDEIGKLFT
ncbi:MAG: AIR synthase family protein [Candidatus Latescibacterota bacterium]|nr:AIR synthase family protein [Candidatus Latescibacterota bacterium]